MSRVAAYFPNYLKTFGILAGCRLFCAAMLLATRRGTAAAARLSVPGHTPLWLRPAAGDLSIFHQVFVKEEYQTGQFAQHAAMIAECEARLAAGERPVIIDCGAHIGLSALWLSHRFPGCVCYALEPDPANFAMLLRNTAGHPGIVALHGGIWDRPASLHIANQGAGATALRLSDGPAAAPDGPVRGYTIDQILALAGSDRAFIVKIDIEGGEASLFRTNIGWLERVGLVTIELHDWLYPRAGTSQAFFRAAGAGQFDCVLRGENLFLFRHF